MVAPKGNGSGLKLKSWEFPKGSKIKVREKLNSNNGQYYGCSYRVFVPAKLTGGNRLIKQFSDKEEAFEWAEEQWEGFQQSGRDYQELSVSERKEASLAYEMAKQEGFDLIDVVKFALPLMKQKHQDVTVQKVIDELTESKTNRFERGHLRELSLKDFKMRSSKFALIYGGRLIQSITVEDIKSWLFKLELSSRSLKNYRMNVGEIFKYARQKQYVLFNPLENLSDEENKLMNGTSDPTEPAILTIKEAKHLLKVASDNLEIGMLPCIVLGLFCGIRTEELKRMEWKEVNLDRSPPFVSIPSTKAKKRRIRHVEIPENAQAWLKQCQPKSDAGKLVPANTDGEFDYKFKRVLQLAGWIKINKDKTQVSSWKKNSMRHSFGSYDYALCGDPMRTARLLGHKSNDDVLFSHYRALATKSKAEKYFAIMP